MENTTSDIPSEAKVSTGDKWFAGYFIAGFIWYFGQTFNKSAADEFIIMLIAISAGYFYHGLKRRVKIQNAGWRATATLGILFFGSAFLIGVFTALARVLG